MLFYSFALLFESVFPCHYTACAVYEGVSDSYCCHFWALRSHLKEFYITHIHNPNLIIDGFVLLPFTLC